MKYWLMALMPHAAEFPWWMQNHSWPIYLDAIDERLNEGDIVFLANQERGIYAWGNLLEKVESDAKDASSITIGRGDIKQSLVDPNQINQSNDLMGILSFPTGRFTFLTNKQVKVINSWLPNLKPPLPRGRQFILGQPASEDEGLKTEYKDVNIGQIPKHAYDYAVAFLGGEGGSIFFGIRDIDKAVVGISMNYAQRDELKKTIENKLLSIVPPISPVKDYSIDFHNILDIHGKGITNLYIIEVEIKPGAAAKYRTAGGKGYDKTYSGKRRID